MTDAIWVPQTHIIFCPDFELVISRHRLVTLSACGLFTPFSGFFGLVQAHKLSVKSLMLPRSALSVLGAEGSCGRWPCELDAGRQVAVLVPFYEHEHDNPAPKYWSWCAYFCANERGPADAFSCSVVRVQGPGVCSGLVAVGLLPILTF
jgi:hypothetical protein